MKSARFVFLPHIYFYFEIGYLSVPTFRVTSVKRLDLARVSPDKPKRFTYEQLYSFFRCKVESLTRADMQWNRKAEEFNSILQLKWIPEQPCRLILTFRKNAT